MKRHARADSITVLAFINTINSLRRVKADEKRAVCVCGGRARLYNCTPRARNEGSEETALREDESVRM